MLGLDYISDADLRRFVEEVLDKGINAIQNADKKFHKNVVDPFSAAFDISVRSASYETWEISEKARQAQKTLQNAIGNFHQNVLGSVEGWNNLGTGAILDIENRDKKIIAEIKNKHNTVRKADLPNLYDTLAAQIKPKHSAYKGYAVYYVQIIPAKPERFDRPFTPSDSKTGELKPSDDNIREIDGASFYSLVTGRPKALRELFDVLPKLLNQINAEADYLTQADVQSLSNLFQIAYEGSTSQLKLSFD